MSALQYRLDRLAEIILSPATKKVVEHTLVRIALVLFFLHLLIFGIHEAGWLPFPMPESLFGHPLHVLYTPFSAILVAEVYLLVYHLPSSFARSMGKQLEIVSLIEIRSVFKDLSVLQEADGTVVIWPWNDPFFPHIVGALINEQPMISNQMVAVPACSFRFLPVPCFPPTRVIHRFPWIRRSRAASKYIYIYTYPI